MNSDKSPSPHFLLKNSSSGYGFFRRRKNQIIVVVTLFFLIGFPVFIYIGVKQTIGVWELLNLRESVITDSPEVTLTAISNYYQEFSPRLILLEVELKALEKMENPSWDTQIKKIHLIKLIIQETWFPEVTLYKRLVDVLYALGYYRESLYYLESHVITDNDLSDSDRVAVQTQLYEIYMVTHDYKKAINMAQEVLVVHPDDPKWLFKLSKSYIADEQYTSARIVLEKIIYYKNDNPYHQQAFFELITVLTQLDLGPKVEFYTRLISSIYSTPEEQDLILREYARYLITTKKDKEQAIISWQVPYFIFNPKVKSKSLKNSFEKYLKS